MKLCVLLITVVSLLFSSPVAHAVDFSKTLKPVIPPKRLNANKSGNTGSKAIGITLLVGGLAATALSFSYYTGCPEGYTESTQGRCFAYTAVGRSGVIEEEKQKEEVHLERPLMLGIGLAAAALGAFILDKAESRKKVNLYVGPTHSRLKVSF